MIVPASLYLLTSLQIQQHTGTPGAHTVIQALHACNDAIAIMVMGVLWISPIGIASLIAASICNACNIGATVMALGLWMLTVLLGLVLMVSCSCVYLGCCVFSRCFSQ